MRLTTGDTAPDFVTKDINGNTIALEDYKDKKLLLSFFRYAGCTFCNLQFIKLMKRYENFHAQGLEIIAFFQSSEINVQEYIAKYKPPFPLVPDPEKKIYNLYGIESSILGVTKSILTLPGHIKEIRANNITQGRVDGDVFLMPADFLIKPPNLTITKAHYGSNASSQIPFIDIENFLLFA